MMNNNHHHQMMNAGGPTPPHMLRNQSPYNGGLSAISAQSSGGIGSHIKSTSSATVGSSALIGAAGANS